MICPACRARFRALLTTLSEGVGEDLLRRACQLEPGLRQDPRVDEEMCDDHADRLRLAGGRPVMSPAELERRAAAVRKPSSSIPAVRPPEHDTDPSFPAIAPEGSSER